MEGHSSACEIQSNRIATTSAAIQGPEANIQRTKDDAKTTKERLEVQRMEPIEMLNSLQLSTQTLANPRAKKAKRTKGSAQDNPISFRYTTDTQGDYDNSGDTDQVWGEDFNYYMTC